MTTARQSMPDPSRGERHAPTVVFLHIGKTGGSTLGRILRRNFPRRDTLVVRTPGRSREEALTSLAAVPEATRARLQLVMGHTIYGVHELLPRNAVYVTMLRHPVALAVSQYAYVLSRPGHRHHDAARDMSLAEYIVSGLSPEMNNSQTRAISGALGAPYGGNPPDMLDLALDNVANHFVAVGLTERFDESLVLFEHRLALRRLPYVRANVARHKPAVTDEALRLIHEYNENDLRLYATLTGRFDEAIAAIPQFAERIEAFRSTNSRYQRWGGLPHSITYSLPRRLNLRRRLRLR